MVSATNKEEIVGYWELYKIEKLSTDLTKNKRSKFINFKSDGKLEGGRIGEKPNKFGGWELKKDNNILVISGDVNDAGNYTVESLSLDQMILFKDSVRIFLDRGRK